MLNFGVGILPGLILMQKQQIVENLRDFAQISLLLMDLHSIMLLSGFFSCFIFYFFLSPYEGSISAKPLDVEIGITASLWTFPWYYGYNDKATLGKHLRYI